MAQEAEEAEVSLSNPDRLGLLIRCRQKMDELTVNELRSYAQSVIASLALDHLKKMLFGGMNAIKEDIHYQDIFTLNTVINAIISKKKKKQKKQKTDENQESKLKKLSPKIQKNASLTAVIPSAILSNNICTFLTMKSIASLARTDRKLAIICHTPSSINNLMHRHDPYPYGAVYSGMIDGHSYDWNSLNGHRMQNVEKLSIPLMVLQNMHRLNSFHAASQTFVIFRIGFRFFTF